MAGALIHIVSIPVVVRSGPVVGSLVSNSIAILVPVLMLPTRRDKCRGMGDPQ